MNVNGYGRWVLDSLGVWGEGDYLDKLEESFEVELHPTETDTLEDVYMQLEHWNQTKSDVRMGDVFAIQIFRQVIEKAVSELGVKETDFDYYANGMYDTNLKCKGEYVFSWREIVAKYKGKNIKKK